MLKPIKIDLKLNDGTTLCTLDDLEENLSPALFEHFQSGKLAKWLRVRKLEEHANAVEKLLSEIHDREAQSLQGLIELFGGEADIDSLRTAITERKKMLPFGKNVDVEIEQFRNENSFLQLKIEKYENGCNELVKTISEISEIFDTTTRLSTFPILQLTKATGLGKQMQSKLNELQVILKKTMNSTD